MVIALLYVHSSTLANTKYIVCVLAIGERMLYVYVRVCIYFYAPAAESFRRFAYKTFRMGRVMF